MASSFLDSQKTQSVVGIANLAQNRQINRNLKELQKSQEEAARAQAENIAAVR